MRRSSIVQQTSPLTGESLAVRGYDITLHSRRWHKPKDQQVKYNNNNNTFSNKNSYEEEDSDDIDVGEENTEDRAVSGEL